MLQKQGEAEAAGRDDSFPRVMKAFTESAENQLTLIGGDFDQASSSFKALVATYLEDPAKTQVSEFFTKFVKFGELLNNTYEEVVAKRVEEAANAKRAAEKAKRDEALAAKKKPPPPVPGAASSETGVFDQFKNAQAGNADEIVNRLKTRHAHNSLKKGEGKMLTAELSSVLAGRKHTKTPSSVPPAMISPKSIVKE